MASPAKASVFCRHCLKASLTPFLIMGNVTNFKIMKQITNKQITQSHLQKKSRSDGPTSHLLKKTLPDVRPSLNEAKLNDQGSEEEVEGWY
jgi:hypothetical protein